jgi:acyl carrier protein
MTDDLLTEKGIKVSLRNFITESFLPSAGLESFVDDDSFMETGIVDSTGVLELLEFIEETFGIQIEDEEVIPSNLDSLNNLSSFIQRKKADVGP